MSLARIITTLAQHEVEFIIVGGMAGVIQGAPLHTLDLDIVYARTDDNIARLSAALQELAAVFRTDPRRIAPNESHPEPVPCGLQVYTDRCTFGS